MTNPGPVLPAPFWRPNGASEGVAPTEEESRAELARFLRSRRGRISPGEVGLTDGPRRRTAGLRRAEVAFLAGLSTSWYTNLEQGRDVKPSRLVLDSLARVLQMTEDERRYMHALAHGRDGDTNPLISQKAAVAMTTQLIRLADHSPYPVYACNEYFDLLAWNPACRDWYGAWEALDGERRNFLYWLLTSAQARARLVDWADITRDVVARWRSECSRRPADERVERQNAELRSVSTEFATWWSDHEVLEHRSGLRTFRHDQLGEQVLRVVPMVSPALADLGIVYHLPLTPGRLRPAP